MIVKSQKKSESDDPSGLLLVDKPAGMTSHDVVGAVRGMFKIKKVGHGGTLDPSATGLLVLLIGKTTKLSDYIIGGDKTYEGIMRLGVETTTQDAEGEPVGEPTENLSLLTEEAIRAAVKSLNGDIYQTPPMVSAIKKDGVPLYKLARKGQVVEREPRLVHIYNFDITEFGIPDSKIYVKCSKGAYVRTLCHDVGKILGCGAHLAGLRRTQSGNLKIENAVAFSTLKELPRSEFHKYISPVTEAVVL